MKIEITITLPEEILQTVDELCGEQQDRSEFTEAALRSFIARRVLNQNRDQRYARELEILNRYADELNAEAEDVLLYQVEL